MKITAFAGSNSKHSINKRLLQFVVGYFSEHSTELLDLNDFDLPLFGVDLESEKGIPEDAYRFAGKIDSSDILIISLAEHNGAYTAAFKSCFDWISRIKGRKAFGDKPILLMAASDGGRGGSSVLDIAVRRMPFSGGKVIETFSFPRFHDNFDDKTGIVNQELLMQLEEKIKMVKAYMDNNAAVE